MLQHAVDARLNQGIGVQLLHVVAVQGFEHLLHVDPALLQALVIVLFAGIQGRGKPGTKTDKKKCG